MPVYACSFMKRRHSLGIDWQNSSVLLFTFGNFLSLISFRAKMYSKRKKKQYMSEHWTLFIVCCPQDLFYCQINYKLNFFVVFSLSKNSNWKLKLNCECGWRNINFPFLYLSMLSICSFQSNKIFIIFYYLCFQIFVICMHSRISASSEENMLKKSEEK